MITIKFMIMILILLMFLSVYPNLFKVELKISIANGNYNPKVFYLRINRNKNQSTNALVLF